MDLVGFFAFVVGPVGVVVAAGLFALKAEGFSWFADGDFHAVTAGTGRISGQDQPPWRASVTSLLQLLQN